MDNALGTIGLALRAGRLEAGEEPVGEACRSRRCRLLLTASDAAGNALDRAERFAREGQCLRLSLPYTKAEFGAALGRSSCAMAAVTDLGLARAVAERLAGADRERYGEAVRQLQVKEERAARRREKAAAEKGRRGGNASGSASYHRRKKK